MEPGVIAYCHLLDLSAGLRLYLQAIVPDTI